MSTLKLILQMVWRGGAWGVLSGTLLGTAFGAISANAFLTVALLAQDWARQQGEELSRFMFAMLLFALIGAVIGALFGVPTGLMVGLLGGVLLGLITRAFFSRCATQCAIAASSESSGQSTRCLQRGLDLSASCGSTLIVSARTCRS